MDRIFLTKNFTRWMTRNRVENRALLNAVEEMASGLVDAQLGGLLYKKRVALPGRGKRAGARTIVATRHEGKWFFLYGFNKNERSNIGPDDLEILREMAKDLLDLSEEDLNHVMRKGKLKEVSR